MWFSFWKSRDRFSIDELRYLTEQLTKIQIVNEVNKDFVIEALRSIAELITYGDQNDSSFFEFFMEKQVMGQFVRILKISRTMIVSLQLLQTMSIMIQNLKSEHAIYYMFSNEYMNYLITYSFDFRHEELLSYYISFLRLRLLEDTSCESFSCCSVSFLHAISFHSLLRHQDEVASFPLYVEAIRFAFHEETMVRTAVRALTLNVYHVGDDCVNRYVTSAPHADYFSNLVMFFRKQCISLNGLVSDALKNPGSDSVSTILAAVDEIEDNLYYFSDVISAGIPDVGKLITDNLLQLLIFPLLLPSLRIEAVNEIQIGAVASLYLICCILRIVKIKDLANTIAAALFFPLEAFRQISEVKLNGYMLGHGSIQDSHPQGSDNLTGVDGVRLRVNVPNSSSSSHIHPEVVICQSDSTGSNLALR
ncbi:protein transparent testa 9 [Quercus suber]|uniref:Protein transparent testa 9 n=1 Tax=Quercus suber TaxID=58331 RepID=A0AAW0M852_QUESU